MAHGALRNLRRNPFDLLPLLRPRLLTRDEAASCVYRSLSPLKLRAIDVGASVVTGSIREYHPTAFHPPSSRTMTSHRTIETALVLRELPDSVVSRIRENVRTVHYYPDKDVAIPASVLASVDVAFVSWNGFPPSVPSVREAKKLALVQLFSAGAERALASPALKEAVEDGKGAGGPRFAITTASGIGVRSLASWLVTQVFALNFRLPQLILFARVSTYVVASGALAD